jgi:hypothetical protein
LPDWSDRRSSELAADGRPVAAPFNRPVSANIFSGIVIGAVNLGRGRFAMIETLGGDGGLGFSSCCGSLSSANASPGIMRDGGGIDWNFGQKRSLGL